MTRWLTVLLCSVMLGLLAWADIDVPTQSVTINTADVHASRVIKQQAGAFPINFGHSGGWFDESVPGQGMLVDVQPDSRAIFMAWFTHEVMESMKIGDSDHRWITAQGNYGDGVANLTLFLTSGGVFNQSDSVTTTAVGSAQLAFSSCDSAMLDYQFDSGPSGQITLQRLLGSSLCESLVPVADVPDEIVKSQLTAITNVSVLPMDEERLLPDQTVIIEDGLIISVSDAGSTTIPDNAAIIDGRGRFLGPGLMDMHTHMTFGGTRVRDHSGLLFLLNGVTSILNMGDGLSLQPGLLRDRFVGGDLIGPHLYAGAIAYGPLGGRPANITVLTPQAATAYARMAQQQGYDFIKVYNSLSTDVLEQFRIESAQLNLPVIGHLPKNISMQAALEGGQRMIAHVAEVYFTYFANQQNPALLPGAADLMIEHGVYLTDSLTASEAFALNYGGNQASFDQFITRRGVDQQAFDIVSSWRNFFNSMTLQPPGSQPGQLDARLAFFYEMVKSFSDAGVKIILGTDSPGHIGVMSGFSVHENLRIYEEIGLTPFKAYEAGSSTPGEFLTETLGLDVPVGRVMPGYRADLLLLEQNPLSDVVHLQEPLGVMVDGHWRSRGLIQTALDNFPPF